MTRAAARTATHTPEQGRDPDRRLFVLTVYPPWKWLCGASLREQGQGLQRQAADRLILTFLTADACKSLEKWPPDGPRLPESAYEPVGVPAASLLRLRASCDSRSTAVQTRSRFPPMI